MSELERWEARFASPGYHFGTEPNAFLKSKASLLKRGQKALSIADGDGRNGVFLAEQGLDVTAFDFSPTALAKSHAPSPWSAASRPASNRPISTLGSLAHRGIRRGRRGLLPVQRARRRAKVFAGIKRALKPGGLLLMEGYTPSNRSSTRPAGPPRSRTFTRVRCWRNRSRTSPDRDRRIRQRHPGGSGAWRHVRADRSRRIQVRIGRMP